MTAIDHYYMIYGDAAILNTILISDPYYLMTLITPRYNINSGNVSVLCISCMSAIHELDVNAVDV